MSEKENIKAELEHLAPTLAKLKAENTETGFQVPPNYFRQLTTDILAEVQPGPSTQAESWYSRLSQQLSSLLLGRPAFALAGILILIIAGVWLLRIDTLGGNDSPELAVNNDELEAYVLAHIEDFDTDLLIDIYTAEEEEKLDVSAEQSLIEENLDHLLLEMDEEEFESLFEGETFEE